MYKLILSPILLILFLIVACTPEVSNEADIGVTQLQQQIIELQQQIESERQVALEIITACNDKQKEFDEYSKVVTFRLEEQIGSRDEHIKAQDSYIDDLTKFAEDNDPDGFWNRNKTLFGFIGGVLFTGAAVYGAGQLRR